MSIVSMKESIMIDTNRKLKPHPVSNVFPEMSRRDAAVAIGRIKSLTEIGVP